MRMDSAHMLTLNIFSHDMYTKFYLYIYFELRYCFLKTYHLKKLKNVKNKISDNLISVTYMLG